MSRVLILTAILSLLPAYAAAKDEESIWEAAAASYDSGSYASAVESYNKLLERGFVSPDLYYNLGNAYFKNGNLGASIWAYRRALKIDPGMEQAKINLQYVRGFNIDKIVTRGEGFITDIWNAVTGLASSNVYLVCFSTAWWLFCLAAAYVILRPRAVAWPQYLLIVCLTVAIFTGAASATRIKKDQLTRWGVLAVPSAEIREGPTADFDKLEIGHEGLEFEIIGQREGSFLIKLENGLKGWLSEKAVLEI